MTDRPSDEIDSAGNVANHPHSAPGIQTSCPICSGPVELFCTKRAQDHDWKINRCLSCGHGFVANRPSLSDLTFANEDISLVHELGSFTREAYEGRSDARDLADSMARLTKVRGRALDIGAGDGSFSYHLGRHGYQPTLLDLDPRAQQATSFIPGSQFRQVPFESLDDPGPFAAILMSQVLEHALDPMDWLQRSRDLLQPGGLLVIAVPNFGGVYRVLGTNDPFLIPPVHVNFFTPKSLRRAIETAGMRVTHMDSRSGVPVGGGIKAVVRRAWNAGSVLLNATTQGIVLRAFASR